MTLQFNPKTGARGIEWTQKTVGTFGGCMHECQWEMADGTIAICYAKELATKGQVAKHYPHGFEHHYFRPNGLKELTRGKEPMLIFVDSMADLFAANVPEADVYAVLDAMQKAPHHAYQSLTKAAPQLRKYTRWMPPNLWVGVSSPPDFMFGNRLSAGQQQAMLRKSLEVLADVKHVTDCLVWMSAEPVSWDLTAVLDEDHPLDWMVIGAASRGSKYFLPHREHIRKLLELMDATNTPVFFKGNIRALFEQHDFGSDRLQRWREDFPVTYHDGKLIEAVAVRQDHCRQYGWTLNEFTEKPSDVDA